MRTEIATSRVETDAVVGYPEKYSIENELLEKIGREKQEARERFSDLIALVSDRYANLPEAMRQDFVAHNGEILDGVIEVGMEDEFSGEELKLLEIAAILHDMTKADQAEEKFAGIPNYVLVTHAEKAAAEVSQIVTDEYLKKIGIEGNFDEARKKIQEAISQHMGPHPGFMTGILNGVNAKLQEMGEAEIKHPQAEGKISQALLAADMQSLAGINGRNKILSIRASVEGFKKDDVKVVAEYAEYGIELSIGEAALLSGFASAEQARDMIQNEKMKAWVNQAIEESMDTIYHYPSNPKEIISWDIIRSKKDQFEEAQRIADARENLEKIAA